MSENDRKKGEDAFVLALASGSTINAAAKKAEISERTAYRHLEDPELRQRVDEVRTALFDRAVSRLARTSELAVRTLRGLLKSESNSVRLGAARSILDFAFKGHDWADTVARIDALERELEGNSP